MAKKFLDYDGVLYFWQKIKAVFVTDISYNSTSKKIQKTKAGSTSDVVTLATVATSGSYNDLTNQPTIPEGAEKTSTTPKMDGTAAIGSETTWAAGNHVHPTDTSRAPLASPAFTGTPTAPTAATGTATTQIATTAFVANTVGAMTSGVADVKVDNVSVVTSGIANINTFGSYSTPSKGLVPAPPSRDGGSDVKVLTDGVEWKSAGIEVSQPTTGLNAGKLIISSKIVGVNTAIPTASTTNNGAMSATDKTKLDSITMTNGIIDASVLPSFVDDVIEAYARSNQTELGSTWLATGSASGTVITPETGKIYVLMNDSTSYAANSQFRWGGSAYVKLSDGGVSSITNAEIDTIVAS